MNIAFATSADHRNLTDDDRLAAAALEQRGARVMPAVWDDPSIDWATFDSVVVRSTWDYYNRADEFRGWIDSLERAGAPVWNPPALLRWNMEKTYLRDIERAGARIVPTAWLPRGSEGDVSSLLSGVLAERGWKEAVIKPAVSAAAHRTWRVAQADVPAMAGQLAESLSMCDVMVQPFMREIQERGEWSLLFFDGEFSHAVRKTPVAGDFRVQTTFGGQSVSDDPGTAVLEAARRVLSAVPMSSPWLYARVDGIETAQGFMLLELEMLEPSLFLSHSASGTARFAESIMRRAR